MSASVQAQAQAADPKKSTVVAKRSDIAPEEVQANLWSIRPCFLYQEEYEDCKSIKGRFHQYFIHGESIDCHQWGRDYESCLRYERDSNDLKAAKEIIDSEVDRRASRMRAHYQNTVWTKRIQPPDDWKKPLPEFMLERNRNTYLAIKADEMREAERLGERGLGLKEERTLCVIM